MKQNFGKYAIVDNVVHHFEQMPDWWWKIDPPTSGDELRISKFMLQARVEVGMDGVRREYPPTNAEIMHREIALLFGETNIPADPDKPVEEGGAPILKERATVEQVEALLQMMPHAMVMEIWNAIGTACPGWGPVRPKVHTPVPDASETLQTSEDEPVSTPTSSES